MIKAPPFTARRLRELLDYSPETGEFVWRVATNNRMKVGDPAGTGDGKGYIQVRVEGVKYRAHRLAWMYMTGAWPDGEIDHINGVRDDNRIANLRVTDRSGNLQNQIKARSGNRSGYLGVTKRRGGKYVARIRLDGELRHLSTHDTPGEAHQAYLEAKAIMHTKAGGHHARD